jgi:hypothetical protein
MTSTRPCRSRSAPLSSTVDYAAGLAAAPRTGNCPVRLVGAVPYGRAPSRRLAALAVRDADAELRQRWGGHCPIDDCTAPFGDWFPGLLARSRVPVDRAVAAAGRAMASRSGPVTFVRVTRPADAPAAIGWVGAGPDPVGVSAVLRSWEERFGALLVEITADELSLGVAVPPSTRHECLALAAEHVALCREILAADTLRGYAACLREAREWRLRWDPPVVRTPRP